MHQMSLLEENGTAAVDWRIKLMGHIWMTISKGWQLYMSRIHNKIEDQLALKTQCLHHHIQDIQNRYIQLRGQTHPSFIYINTIKEHSNGFLEMWINMHGQNLITIMDGNSELQ